MKSQLIKAIVKGVVSGIPMIQSIRSAMGQKTDLNAGASSGETKKPNWAVLLQIIVEAGVVIGIAWITVKLGITTEDIKELFGLLK